MTDPSFFPTPEPLDAQRLAAITGASIARSGRRDVRITGIASASRAGPLDLVVASDEAGEAISASRAGAFVLTSAMASLAPERAVVLVTSDPLSALARATEALYPLAARPQAAFGPGVSRDAIIHPQARLEPDVTIDPGVVIGPDAEVGRGTVICANAVVGPGVRIGRASAIGFGASLSHALIGDRVIVRQGARLGQAGPLHEARASSRPGHVGRVIVQDDADIGANATIDRGFDQDTVIGERSRIDNLVNIGHNVVVGRGCVIFALASIAPGSMLQDLTVVGERAGLDRQVNTGAGTRSNGEASGARS